MAELRVLPVVTQSEKRAADVLEILKRFVEKAERGEINEVMVAAIGEDGFHLGASGNVSPTMQIGMLERFKAVIVAQANE